MDKRTYHYKKFKREQLLRDEIRMFLSGAGCREKHDGNFLIKEEAENVLKCCYPEDYYESVAHIKTWPIYKSYGNRTRLVCPEIDHHWPLYWPRSFPKNWTMTWGVDVRWFAGQWIILVWDSEINEEGVRA